jgi:basic membrane protein A
MQRDRLDHPDPGPGGTARGRISPSAERALAARRVSALTRLADLVTIGSTILSRRRTRFLPPLMLVVLAATIVAATAKVPVGQGAARQVQIGLVVTHDTPTSADGSLGRMFMQVVKRFGATGRILYQPPNLDPRGPLVEFAREQYDLIVTGANVDPAVVAAVAARFPKAKFDMTALGYANMGRRAVNVEGSVYRSEQASYLAGFLATRMESRRKGRKVISSVGGYPFPLVDAWIAGFEAGAKRADPRVVTLLGYAHSFDDTTKCRAVALNQIAAGSGVVFPAAGACGLGALDAAKRKRVWAIGVDVDQSALGPFVLTSAIGRYDTALSDAVRATVAGTFKTGGDSVYDLKNGGVGLGKISPLVPRSLVLEVNRIRAEIVAGKIKVPSSLS